MFDPTTRLQSARMHGHELHHAARHSTPHAADHALLRRAARSVRRPLWRRRAVQPAIHVTECPPVGIIMR